MKERVLQFIEYTGLNKASFEKMVGLSNGAVDKMGANTRHSTVDKISKTFPEINRDWLMTGKGNMKERRIMVLSRFPPRHGM